ncbi:auxin-responsive protein SAUR21-like [Ipomoea triloba]|uniref:auxin-responsive protein SAUR21-like n=1 Tax=Ipomoea triloba TaxID=35885 RepID=UPI00125D4484|nr:auxin-responsive protein SAUR21-like [Ipomoea triloba]
MAIRVPSVTHSSRILRKFSSRDIPKGHLAVYVGQDDQKKRYVSHPWFQDLLSQAQEEFGFNHSMGGLTIPCIEDAFVHLTSGLVPRGLLKQQSYRLTCTHAQSRSRVKRLA